MLNDFKKTQKECDTQSYFIKKKMYADLKPIEILKHNCFHLMNLVAKLSAVCEQEEHNNQLPLDKIKNEVIPDLIIYALQFANTLQVDIDQKFEERIQSVINKYDPKMLPKKNEHVVQSLVETKWGPFNFFVWKGFKGQEPLALVTPHFDPSQPVILRIHSECITGDTFGSRRCDCGGQKDVALKLISQSANGIFIYHRQEGRGIGLFEKIKSYKIQRKGIDTYQANLKLGWKPDERDYQEVAKILRYFKIDKVKLLTNNPSKMKALMGFGFEVTESIPLPGEISEHNLNYLKTKIEKFGHEIKLEEWVKNDTT